MRGAAASEAVRCRAITATSPTTISLLAVLGALLVLAAVGMQAEQAAAAEAATYPETLVHVPVKAAEDGECAPPARFQLARLVKTPCNEVWRELRVPEFGLAMLFGLERPEDAVWAGTDTAEAVLDLLNAELPGSTERGNLRLAVEPTDDEMQLQWFEVLGTAGGDPDASATGSLPPPLKRYTGFVHTSDAKTETAPYGFCTILVQMTLEFADEAAREAAESRFHDTLHRQVTRLHTHFSRDSGSGHEHGGRIHDNDL